LLKKELLNEKSVSSVIFGVIGIRQLLV